MCQWTNSFGSYLLCNDIATFRTHNLHPNSGPRRVLQVFTYSTESLEKFGEASKTSQESAKIWWKMEASLFQHSSGSFLKILKLLLVRHPTTLHIYIHCFSARRWHRQVFAIWCNMLQAALTWQPYNKDLIISPRTKCAFRQWPKTLAFSW